MKNQVYSILFLMDPFESLNLETETSLLLMQEFLDRGHKVFWLEETGLSLVHGRPRGEIAELKRAAPLLRDSLQAQYLDQFDMLVIRKDPPFDQGFLHLTLILDHLNPSVIQVNHGASLRNYNEKLLPLRWPEFTPPTLVSQDATQLTAFADTQGEIVLKPLDDCSGRGIEKVRAGAAGSHRAKIDSYLRKFSGFVLAQAYLPQVQAGDKRIYLVDGEVAGVVNRIPAAGSFLANIHCGAKCEATELNRREMAIIAAIKPFLCKQGILLAGADIIDGNLTELNITSPSAVRQINEVTGLKVHECIVDGMLKRLDMTSDCCGFASIRCC